MHMNITVENVIITAWMMSNSRYDSICDVHEHYSLSLLQHVGCRTGRYDSICDVQCCHNDLFDSIHAVLMIDCNVNVYHKYCHSELFDIIHAVIIIDCNVHVHHMSNRSL
jgi:hypothetical protein